MRVHAREVALFSPQEAAEAISVIAAGLRPADREEVSAATGGDPAAVLKLSVALSSRAWFILDRHGAPIGVFGVAPTVVPGVGSVWMLGTEGMEREWVGVARQTRKHLDEIHLEYHTLWNFIDARNELSLNWLLRSGFHLIDADPHYGVEGRLFFEFARTG